MLKISSDFEILFTSQLVDKLYIICIKNFNKESIYSKDKSEKAIKLIKIKIYIYK